MVHGSLPCKPQLVSYRYYQLLSQCWTAKPEINFHKFYNVYDSLLHYWLFLYWNCTIILSRCSICHFSCYFPFMFNDNGSYCNRGDENACWNESLQIEMWLKKRLKCVIGLGNDLRCLSLFHFTAFFSLK